MWFIFGSAGFLLGVMFMAIVCSNRVAELDEEIIELIKENEELKNKLRLYEKFIKAKNE